MRAFPARVGQTLKFGGVIIKVCATRAMTLVPAGNGQPINSGRMWRS